MTAGAETISIGGGGDDGETAAFLGLVDGEAVDAAELLSPSPAPNAAVRRPSAEREALGYRKPPVRSCTAGSARSVRSIINNTRGHMPYLSIGERRHAVSQFAT